MPSKANATAHRVIEYLARVTGNVQPTEVITEVANIIRFTYASRPKKLAHPTLTVRKDNGPIGQGGWNYYDALGKDFGPYKTKGEALKHGPEAAKAEERLMQELRRQTDDR